MEKLTQNTHKLSLNLDIKNNIKKALLTDEESAEYLNISITPFNRILENNIREKQELLSHSTDKFIPYIEVGNGEKRFSKKQLDEWINYNMLNK